MWVNIHILAPSNLPFLLHAFTTSLNICNLAIIITILPKCLTFCIRPSSLIGPMNLSQRGQWRYKTLDRFLVREQAKTLGVKASQLFCCTCHKHH